MQLERRLPDVFMVFERWAVIDAEAKEAARLKEIEKQERRAREDGLATEAYCKHALGERLVADLDEWELSARLGHYLSLMAQHVDLIDGADERAAAGEWLAWCRRYASERNPLVRPIRTPWVEPPGYSELQEFRSQLGFRNRY